MSLSIIHIPQFEGPLALLLHLIRKEEMDILDINVQLITSQYLEYIKKMKQFDLEVAGDFIAMAATLIQIKSKMLLPVSPDQSGQEEEEMDPRGNLVQCLLEYQRFQEASKKLYSRSLLNRDVFKRNQRETVSDQEEEARIILDENALFSLMTHYMNSIRKMKRAIHRVAKKTRSITSRILEIRDRFIVNQRIRLRELVDWGKKDIKEELLVTFLSCLELGKMGFVSLYQSKVYGDIYLMGKRQIPGDAVTGAENYSGSDGQN